MKKIPEVIIVTNLRKVNKYGVRKYGFVRSKTTKGKLYIVGKIRKFQSKNYKYICECPDNFFRQRTCKHIKLFKKVERS